MFTPIGSVENIEFIFYNDVFPFYDGRRRGRDRLHGWQARVTDGLALFVVVDMGSGTAATGSMAGKSDRQEFFVVGGGMGGGTAAATGSMAGKGNRRVLFFFFTHFSM